MTRQPGRPRSEQSRTAILTAARDLLLQAGYERLTIESIAVQAHVSKQTIYRWWASKSAIVAEAVLDGVVPYQGLKIRQTDSLSHDLEVWWSEVLQAFGDPHQISMVRALAAAAADNQAESEILHQRLSQPMAEALIDRLKQGQSTGEVKPDLNLSALTDALFGTLLFWVLTGRQGADQPAANDVLRVVLHGALVAPAPPPDASENEQA